MTPQIYSPISHIALSVFPNRNPRRTHMAMFSGYFDASGDSSDPKLLAVTVGGWITTVDKWQTFEREWKSYLNSEGLESLHMAEFLYQTKDDIPRQQRVLHGLIRIIKRRVNYGIASTLWVKDFLEVDRLYEVSEHWGGPYSLVGIAVIGMVAKWMRKAHPHDPLRFYFEKGDTGQLDFMKCIERLDVEYVVNFEPKRDGITGSLVISFSGC